MTKLLTSGNSEKSPLTQWISRNFQFQKQNPAPWGSYSIAVSVNGQQWAAFPRRFGSSFTPEEAFEMILTDSSYMSIIDGMFRQFVGNTLYQEFKKFV